MIKVTVALLLAMSCLTACETTSKTTASINKAAVDKAVAEQTATILKQAEANERKASQIPKQPPQCFVREKIDAQRTDTPTILVAKLNEALSNANYKITYCSSFSEQVRLGRIK